MPVGKTSFFISAISAFIASLAQIGGALIIIPIVDRIGRRIILMVTTSIMSVSIMALGVFFYLKANIKCELDLPEGVTLENCDPDGKYTQDLVDTMGFLPLVSLILYILAFCSGQL